MYPAVPAFFGGGYRIRVIPKIETVDIFIIEPKAKVMGMVDGLAGARFEGETAGDQLSVGCIYRVENRLFQGIGVNKGGKGFTACCDRHGMGGGVGYDPDRELMLGLKEAGQHDQEE